MSGILAAAQSSGCCCRPQEGCTCSDENRPGAIVDRSTTSIAVACDLTVDDAELDNGCYSLGCSCPCSGTATYGSFGGIRYGYQRAGAIIDPDFIDGTECEGRGCTAGCCGGCPTWRCSSNFDTAIAEQVNAGVASWSSVIAGVFDNEVARWNWAPLQVGYCASDTDPLLRIRKYCPFSWLGATAGGFVDPSGQYVNVETGEYLGGNVGLLRAYRATEVTVATSPGGPCAYLARVSIGYLFQAELEQLLGASVGGRIVGIPFFPGATASIIADYAKPCLSPTDTVFGTYTRIGDPAFDYYDEDGECGPIRFFRERRVSVPLTLEIS